MMSGGFIKYHCLIIGLAQTPQAACAAVVDGSGQLEAVAAQAQNYVVTGTYKAVRCVTTQRMHGLLGCDSQDLVVTLGNVFGYCCAS